MIKTNRTIYIFLMVFALSGVFGPTAARGQFYYMENEDIGKPVKDFTLKLVDGEMTNFTKYRDGQRAIVFFWATWCPHCRAQLKRLNGNIAAIEAKGIRIVPVDIGEYEPIVKKYLEKQKIDIDVFLDEESIVADDYGLVGVPTFYYVKKDGTVAAVQHALADDIEAVFEK